MKIIEPSYEIWDCPDGEAALAKIERIGRECYKSEGSIKSGVACEVCNKTGVVTLVDQPSGDARQETCGNCSGTGWHQVPSSHAFVRMVLRTNRREQLKKRVVALVRAAQPSSEEAIERIACDAAMLALDDYRDDPPHDGLLENASVTVHFTADRGFTHELVRHRHGSYAQESTRYCNYSKGKFGESITVIKQSFELEEQAETWMHALGEIEKDYMKLIASGVKPEIARDVLSQATKASITLTVNFNSLRNFFRKRCSPRAHPRMRALMIPFRDEMRRRIPIIFDELI